MRGEKNYPNSNKPGWLPQKMFGSIRSKASRSEVLEFNKFAEIKSKKLTYTIGSLKCFGTIRNRERINNMLKRSLKLNLLHQGYREMLPKYERINEL